MRPKNTRERIWLGAEPDPNAIEIAIQMKAPMTASWDLLGGPDGSEIRLFDVGFTPPLGGCVLRGASPVFGRAVPLHIPLSFLGWLPLLVVELWNAGATFIGRYCGCGTARFLSFGPCPSR